MRKTGYVVGIEDQNDRVLLYLRDDYHVIASREDVRNICVGDQITYEPCGMNFGWLCS